MKKRFKEPTTTYKQGGKSDWISNKIAEIMHEGKYKQDQAIAIAYSMYNELPKHQTGRAPIQPVDNMQPMGYSFNQIPTTQGMPPQGGMYQAPTAEQMYSQTDPYLFQSSQNPPQANAAPNSNMSTPLSSNEANNPYLYQSSQNAASQNVPDPTPKQSEYLKNQAEGKTRNSYQMYTPQFYNPENLAVYAGMNAKKNPVMAGVAGVGAVAGIGRAFLSGMAGENRNTQIGQDYASAQRDKLTGYNNPEQMSAGTGANYNTMSYRQDGGEQMPPQQEGQQGSQEEQVVQFIQEALQQQADPQEIAQQLIQMGMQPEQVQQLISAVMQQMQGGEQQQDMSQQSPDQQQDMGLSQQQDQMQDAQQYKNGGQYLNMLRGKRIVDYKYNAQTNSYDVEYQ